jgi:hypothetical protein
MTTRARQDLQFLLEIAVALGLLAALLALIHVSKPSRSSSSPPVAVCSLKPPFPGWKWIESHWGRFQAGDGR